MFTSILLQIEIYIGKPDNTKEPVGNRQALLIEEDYCDVAKIIH